MAVFQGLPRFYPILDADLLAQAGISIERFARELREAGVRFLQYRDKTATDSEAFGHAALLRGIFPVSDSLLIMNDRVALARAAQLEGVHLGQDDMPPAEARCLLGCEAVIGLSAHNERQVLDAAKDPADYLAVGPVFTTVSKQNPDPVIGLEGVAAARRGTGKPLVAIGGITLVNCAAVLEAGADAVAVISALVPRAGESVRSLAEEFLLLTGGTV